MSQIAHCRVCGKEDLRLFFDLGSQPLANSLLRSAEEKEIAYPLALFFCENCSLVQLGYTVDPEILFSQYVWVTGTSRVANEYAKVFLERLLKRAEVKKDNEYILEIASNDGTFLKPFQERGYRVLGIDPAKNIAEIAERDGVPTEAVFWTNEAAESLLKEKGAAKAIFARNVLPHVANTRDFVKGISTALQEDGVVVIEAHYAKIILDELHYDSIYHEHLCYFTLKSLEGLLGEFGLYVFDIETSPISGGSMVVYARKNKGKGSAELIKFREIENIQKVNDLNRWEEFTKCSFDHRAKLTSILEEVKKRGGDVVGWGASARSSTMLNFAGIDTSLLSSIIDLNPLKQGLYTAGTHIPIETAESGMARNPGAVFILAWNFREEIVDALRNRFGFRGACIIPLPGDPKIQVL